MKLKLTEGCLVRHIYQGEWEYCTWHKGHGFTVHCRQHDVDEWKAGAPVLPLIYCNDKALQRDSRRLKESLRDGDPVHRHQDRGVGATEGSAHMTFHINRARRYAGLIRYDAGDKYGGGLVLEKNPELVRPITGAPEWLSVFLPSVHKDRVGDRWRVRSCIAPCTVSNKAEHGPVCGLAFAAFKTQRRFHDWLNSNPDWPYAMLYSIHANYILESGRFFRNRLGDRARAAWTDEHTGVVAGWKILKGL